MAFRNNGKKKDIFSKKVPVNPRYQNIQHTVDTGVSATNYLKRIEEIRKHYRYKKDEIFKRMKVSIFAELVSQVAQVWNMEVDRMDLETPRTHFEEDAVVEEEHNAEKIEGSLSERHLLQDVISGVGEIEIQSSSGNNSPSVIVKNFLENTNEVTMPDLTSLPYILLDVRDRDAYEQCHIIGSLNYPSAELYRENYASKEMLLFKNKPGKIIIVYDADEKIATHVATVLVQRGIDNVIMLSGGLKILNKKFPSCFITGTLPSNCFSPKLNRKGKFKAPPNIVENVGVDWFTPDLLELIRDRLEEELQSRESSRLSSRSSRSARLSTGRSSIASTSSNVRPASWR